MTASTAPPRRLSECGSMVERSLRVREVPGSSPGTPTEKIHYLFKYLQLTSFLIIHGW